MVIVGTYLCFHIGQRRCCAAFCRRTSAITTRPKHFVSVSSMTYRMKRNGAGLASICILSNDGAGHDLLHLAACTSGMSRLRQRDAIPRDINVHLVGYDAEAHPMTEENADALTDKLVADRTEIQSADKTSAISGSLAMSGGRFRQNGAFDVSECFSGSSDIIDYGKITNLRIVSLSDYNSDKRKKRNACRERGSPARHCGRITVSKPLSLGSVVDLHREKDS